MAESCNGVWLSTTRPPKTKQQASVKKQVARGPLSRKLLPLQMMSSHSSLLSSLTQNSPPPPQLKTARKQSSLMDYFGKASDKHAIQHFDYGEKVKRNLNFGVENDDVVVLETNGSSEPCPLKTNGHCDSDTVPFSASPPSKKLRKLASSSTAPESPYSNSYTCWEGNRNFEALSTKASGTRQCLEAVLVEVSPLKETQVSSVMKISPRKSLFSEEPLERKDKCQKENSPEQGRYSHKPTESIKTLSPMKTLCPWKTPDFMSESLTFGTHVLSSPEHSSDINCKSHLSPRKRRRSSKTALGFSFDNIHQRKSLSRTTSDIHNKSCVASADGILKKQSDTEQTSEGNLYPSLHQNSHPPIHVSSFDQIFAEEVPQAKLGFDSQSSDPCSVNNNKCGQEYIRTANGRVLAEFSDVQNLCADSLDFDTDSQIEYLGKSSSNSNASVHSRLSVPSFPLDDDSSSLQFTEQAPEEKDRAGAQGAPSPLKLRNKDNLGRFSRLKAKCEEEMETLNFTETGSLVNY